jgi:hypothetical protein
VISEKNARRFPDGFSRAKSSFSHTTTPRENMTISDNKKPVIEAPTLGKVATRRSFLRDSAVAAAVAGTLAACKKAEGAASVAAAAEHGTPNAAPAAAPSPREKADAMDKMHEAVM